MSEMPQQDGVSRVRPYQSRFLLRWFLLILGIVVFNLVAARWLAYVAETGVGRWILDYRYLLVAGMSRLFRIPVLALAASLATAPVSFTVWFFGAGFLRWALSGHFLKGVDHRTLWHIIARALRDCFGQHGLDTPQVDDLGTYGLDVACSHRLHIGACPRPAVYQTEKVADFLECESQIPRPHHEP